MNSQPLHLLVGLQGDMHLLPQFLLYYCQRGVTLFVVHACTGEVLEAARPALRDYPHVVAQVWSTPYDWQRKLQVEADGLAKHSAGRWTLLPDLDELWEFEPPLPEQLERADAANCNALRGRFLDRVTEGGALPEPDPTRCLFEAFPYTAEVTSRVIRGATALTAAVRGWAPANRHATHDGAGQLWGARPPRFLPGTNNRAHHFKWSSRAKARMAERAARYRELYEAGDPAYFFWPEGLCLQEHLSQHGGRLDVAHLGREHDGRCLFTQGHPAGVSCSLCPSCSESSGPSGYGRGG